MQNSRGGITTYRVLLAALLQAFAHRGEGTFNAHFCLSYADTKDMITIGGYFGAAATSGAIRDRLRASMPFLLEAPPEPYTVKRFNITERERALFDVAFKGKRKTKSHNDLVRLGFKEADITTYNELIRFIPRYVEVIF